MLPFESWDEVEAVACECRDWGPLVIFMADTGARPCEAVAVERKHIDGSVVELPGRKTEGAWRTVHMTIRGVAAVESVPPSDLDSPRLSHRRASDLMGLLLA